MHVIIGVLTSLLTIFYLLDRLGIDIGGLNPFYWYRRRKWAEKYHGDPIYGIEDPMHIAAILVIGVAKLDGDLTAEQKDKAIAVFKSEFSLSDSDASQLVGSATHLLGAPQIVDTQLKGLIEKNAERFSGEQLESLRRMVADFAASSSNLSTTQQEYLQNIGTTFGTTEQVSTTWS